MNVKDLRGLPSGPAMAGTTSEVFVMKDRRDYNALRYA
jgi:hypothetical protein